MAMMFRRTLIFSAVMLTVLTGVSDGQARVTVVGNGARRNFSPEGIPEAHRPAFALMQKKCVKCHSMERTVVAITTGKAPVTGQPFNKQAVKAYGIKMLRKPDSGMNKQEIRDIVLLLNYLIDENSE